MESRGFLLLSMTAIFRRNKKEKFVCMKTGGGILWE